MSLAGKGRFGSLHNAWKGDDIGYQGIHVWIWGKFGKASKCENLRCKNKFPKRFEWANISGQYRRDRSDFIQLCCSCHRKYDLGCLNILTALQVEIVPSRDRDNRRVKSAKKNDHYSVM